MAQVTDVLEETVRHLIAEARELERLRVAAWLLAEAIRIFNRGDMGAAGAIRSLAQKIKANAIELDEGGDC